MKTNLKYILLLIFLSKNVSSQTTNSINSAFFGIDSALPMMINFICPGGAGLDGMPVNFNLPIDHDTLDVSDFEVVDSMGNVIFPICATLAPAFETGEGRTVLLVGEFGSAISNPPTEVRVVGDLFTRPEIAGESSCSDIINFNGESSTNIIPLSDGPSLFFAQHINGDIDECLEGSQTIQVAWDGGVVPFVVNDLEEDLFQYYTGYSMSSGKLIEHTPVAIADINDNDNFHQLCFSTNAELIMIGVDENRVEDPNGDPNQATEITVDYCYSNDVIFQSTFD